MRNLRDSPPRPPDPSCARAPAPGGSQGWFDDRVECRNALSKLGYLNGIEGLDRAYLPWTRYPEERELLMMAGVVDFDSVPQDADE